VKEEKTMKEITISELRKMSADDIRAGGCLRIMADGEQVAIVVVGAIQGMGDRIAAIASQIDAARGK
jgi:hypothetical protein